MRHLIVILAALSLLLVPLSPVRAQNNVGKGFTLEPAYQDIELKKGEEKEIVITLYNQTNTETKFNLYALNFKQNEYGSIEFLPRDSESFSYALASYIHIPQDSITLDPRSKESIKVIIRDRQDLSPGGHYAGIVAQAVSTNKNKMTHINPALAGLLLLRKTGGEIFNLSLTEISWPQNIIHLQFPDNISLTFRNEGNIHVAPRGRIEVKDIFARIIYKGIINTSSKYIFPSSRRTITIPLERVSFSLPIMFYSISVSGNDSLHKVSFSHRDTFIFISPLFLAFLIIFITSVYFIIKKINLRK